MARERLPAKRTNATYEIDLTTATGRIIFTLCCSVYADGRLGEVFIDHPKVGTIIRTMLNVWAMTASISLQSGIPVERIVAIVKDNKDETAGTLHIEEIPSINKRSCSSIWDAIAAVLEAEYLP